MKNVYINSRLHPMLVEPVARLRRTWLFSRGEPWLLLTPERLGVLAERLGNDDDRICRLLGLVRRHSPEPERFCRRLGVEETRYLRPEEYPPVLCPYCDGLHQPHPEDAGRMCEACCEKARQDGKREPGGGAVRDRRMDRIARGRLLAMDPSVFDEGRLWPNYKFNQRRRLHRDWDKAVNRVLMGAPYRQVSKEFSCSVGLLHRKVKEQYWERN